MPLPKDPIKYQEYIEKQRSSHKGKPSPRKGVKLSEETKLKLHLANLGKKPSRETRTKISNALRSEPAMNR